MTKLQLLNQISEEDIFSKYIPGFSPTSSKNYKSPFGDKDNKPSLSVYKDGQHFKFKSHNTGNQGDCFQFVADIKGLNCKNDFDAVIEAIAEDFSLNGFSPSRKNERAKNTPNDGKKKSIKISFEKAPSVEMLKYFGRFKIDLETIIRFDVRQVKYHEFVTNAGKLCKFDYKRLNKIPVCYTVADKIKIYFPAIDGIQEKSFGYKDQTTTDIFGFRQIAELHHTNLFIAAGEKDCLALNANGFASIAFQSENTIPNASQTKAINILADNVFVVYDNDTPGKQAADKLCTFNKWHSLQLPEGFKDVADFFEKKSKEDFQKLVDSFQKSASQKNERAKNTPNTSADDADENSFTIFHQTEKYLSANYDLRYNTIKLELEVSEKGVNDYGQLNENDLFVELNKKGVKVGMDKLIAILKSSFVKKFNPVAEYFKTLPPWDEERDYIGELARHLHCENVNELIDQFTKWLVRVVRCAMEEGYFNKQAFILVHAKQNSGKSTFCRFLCPPALKDYLAENITDDKDSRIALAKNFLVNLDELSSLAKHEINSLKSLFSKDIINERLPYDRKNSIIHRVASFVGSTNMAEFLTDETGSVRWLCFEIKEIDWNYKKAIDINKVWGQAYDLYKSGYECDMTREDIDRNEQRNIKFQQLSTEAEIIPKFFSPAGEDEPESFFMSATEILMHISQQTTVRINKVMIGRAMPICGFKRVKDSQKDRYGYWVRKAGLF